MIENIHEIISDYKRIKGNVEGIVRVLQLKKESIRKRSNLIIMYGLY